MRINAGTLFAALLAGVAFVLSASGAWADRIKIVAFGDSLSAGYGLAPKDAFPVQLEAALRKAGHNVEVVNSGVSGDTTGAGLQRLGWAIPSDADGVILQLGANDALRGISPEIARRNLDAILKKLRAKDLPILIAGMRAPANWGDGYQTKFDAMYPELAATYDARLYPFFLDGVVLNAKLNQRDGIHPNAEGVGVIVERVLPKVEALIADIEAQRSKS